MSGGHQGPRNRAVFLLAIAALDDPAFDTTRLRRNRDIVPSGCAYLATAANVNALVIHLLMFSIQFRQKTGNARRIENAADDPAVRLVGAHHDAGLWLALGDPVLHQYRMARMSSSR